MPGAIIIALIPLLPLLSFLLLGLYGRKIFKNASGIIGTISLLVSFMIAVFTAYSYFHLHQGSHPAEIPFKYTWLQFNESMSIAMGLQLDPISVMMILIVT